MRKKIAFKKLVKKATLPRYARSGDAGFDLFALDGYSLKTGERHLFGLGLAAEIPAGFAVVFWSKSGLAQKAGVAVMAGLIDSGYRGEWGVLLVNHGEEEYEVKSGDKIAQGVLLRVDQAVITETAQLPDSERGEGGFGSTGR